MTRGNEREIVVGSLAMPPNIEGIRVVLWELGFRKQRNTHHYGFENFDPNH
jgi:hypothetical protein